MNILSINSLPAQTSFQARGVKPSKLSNFNIKRERFLNTDNNSKELLEAKIKYATKRLAAEEDYLKNEVTSYAERQYVERTIMRLMSEISNFKNALAKAVSRKV